MLIKKKLPVLFILLSVLPLLFLSVTVYHFSSDSLVKSSKDHILNTTKIESDVLNALISGQRSEVELIAQKESIIRFLKNRADASSGGQSQTQDDAEMAIELDKRVKEVDYLRRSFIINVDGKVAIDNKNELQGIPLNDRSYYQNAMEGKPHISEVLHSKVDGRPMVVLAAPIKDEKGNIIGVFCNEFYTEYFVQFTSSIKIGETGYAYILGNDGRMIAHPDKKSIGNILGNTKVQNILKKIEKENYSPTGIDSYTYNEEDKYFGYSYIPELNWLLVVVQNIEEVYGPARLELYIVIGVTILMILLSSIFSILVAKAITTPISELTESMNKASEGDLTSVCHYRSKNELGQLAKNFNIMIEKLGSSYQKLEILNEEIFATHEELVLQNEELLMSQRRLSLSEERYKQALDGINDVVWEYDIKTKNLFVSEKWFDLIGYRLKDIHVRRFIQKSVLPEYRTLLFDAVRQHIQMKSPYFSCEIKVKTGEGKIKWILLRGNALYDMYGQVMKFVGAITDVTMNKTTEEKIKKLAYYDTLTALPNRTVFINTLLEELNKCKKNNEKGAVLFLDLDNFKVINDSLGHDVGDLLLIDISNRLSGILKKEDMLCRFGGDEFLILKKKVQNKTELEQLSTTILSALEKSFDISGKKLYVTASIGISIFPENGNNPAIVLKNADTAMYKAKESGKNNFRFYNEEMSKSLIRNVQIEKEIREGLNKNNFLVYYQPQIEIKTGKVIGIEALVRLKSEELGIISPMEFIPVAEKTGLISFIDEWVMKTACEQNAEWKRQGFSQRISINVSSIELKQHNFVEKVSNIIHNSGLMPEMVEIEITETILMESIERNVNILKRLRELGVRTALDDFGTGYSSLNYLKKIPIDTLKIDKSFIDDICTQEKQEAMVDYIVKMAHEMDIEVVAEGVESQEQLQLLENKNCDLIQGYVISKPLNTEEMTKLLDRKPVTI